MNSSNFTASGEASGVIGFWPKDKVVVRKIKKTTMADLSVKLFIMTLFFRCILKIPIKDPKNQDKFYFLLNRLLIC